MDNKKIAFISCINNMEIYNTAKEHIYKLHIPDGFKVEIIKILNSESIFKGYNIGMKMTDAKYKVYLHQDTYIKNEKIIFDILKIFNSNEKVGLLGVVGTKELSSTGVWYNSEDKYGEVYDSHTGQVGLIRFQQISGESEAVDAIDGLIMITQHDCPWREDIFMGWHFYDVSQCFEMRRKGYLVVIPKQEEIWCLHDCGIVSLEGFEENQQIFLNEYSKEMDNNLLERYQIKSKTDSDIFDFDTLKGLKAVLGNKETFLGKINQAKRNIILKNYEIASRWAYEAARYAMFNHAGCFASPELEKILIECGSHLPGVKLTMDLPKSTGKRRIFHVMSEGYSVGGHTRLVKNWVENDNDSEHYLINTWQIKSTPKWLIDAIEISNGICIPLENVSDSYLARAAVLREIVNRYADLVVCHIHMNDPIPVMAFAAEGGPPVIFINHADHLFWLGTSISDFVFDARSAGQKLTFNRRNVQSSYILPLPLSNPKMVLNKETARRELGLPQDAVVLVSIASPAKYDSFSRYDFTYFLRKILERNKEAIAVMVGPSYEGKWLEASRDTGGRIKAVGVQTENEKYYAASDIYLDSYMFGSMTSSLDAGLRGLPVAFLKNFNNETLSCEDISLEGLNNQFTTIEQYLNYIDKLIESENFRRIEAERLSNQIKLHHIDLWKDYLYRGYALVENMRHSVRLNEFKDKLEIDDLFLALFHEQKRK